MHSGVHFKSLESGHRLVEICTTQSRTFCPLDGRSEDFGHFWSLSPVQGTEGSVELNKNTRNIRPSTETEVLFAANPESIYARNRIDPFPQSASLFSGARMLDVSGTGERKHIATHSPPETEPNEIPV